MNGRHQPEEMRTNTTMLNNAAARLQQWTLLSKPGANIFRLQKANIKLMQRKIEYIALSNN